MTAIHTIGHSNHPIAEFVELLHRHRIAALVDVRSRPYSKWAPHFEKGPLAHALTAEAIEYLFLGRELGGRPEGAEFYTPDGHVDYERRARAFDFQAGIEQLVTAAAGRATAILCAEEDPSRCHRRLLITPALERCGVQVLHIRGDGTVQSEEELRAPAAQLRLFE
jgi:uncharacterized protein (DUF488 family)